MFDRVLNTHQESLPVAQELSFSEENLSVDEELHFCEENISGAKDSLFLRRTYPTEEFSFSEDSQLRNPLLFLWRTSLKSSPQIRNFLFLTRASPQLRDFFSWEILSLSKSKSLGKFIDHTPTGDVDFPENILSKYIS